MPWRKYHTIWFVMAFGWVALYVVRMGISPVLGMIMEEFHISYATAGSLFSAIFLSYTLMQVPSGYLFPKGCGTEVVRGRQCTDLGAFDVRHGLCGGD